MLHRIYFSLGIFDKIQKKLYERRGVMKIVTVIDSFKGSLSSMEAGRAATEGIRRDWCGRWRTEEKVRVRPWRKVWVASSVR